MFAKIKNIFKNGKEQPALRFQGKSVLTIEDDITQRTMIQRTLEKQGFTVIIAENGEKGLEMAQTRSPDLILLDVMMPGLSGTEVCRRLKSDSKTKDIPILFLTSMDSPRDVIEHYDLGAEVHLTKPINPKELISQISISLQSRSGG